MIEHISEQWENRRCGPCQVEYNTFLENNDKWINVIHVYLDSHLYNCQLYGVRLYAHRHNRDEPCKCDNWQELHTE